MSWKTVEKWPTWLATDIPDCAIWSLEHESAPTIFRGKAMHLVDRANNCLPLLLSEPSLKGGEIAFVAHSFGGLVIAELLRVADIRSNAESHIATFLQRVRRIAFLGTPHLGADLASWGGRLALVSKASSVLPRNDPHLRGLNQWFRRYVDDHQIATLTLTETQRTGVFGYIVKPDSSDLGLSTFPIPVDADHYSIASPSDRNSEIYRHIRDFLCQAGPPVHPRAALTDAVADQTASIERLAQQSAGGFERLEKSLADSAAKQTSIFRLPQSLVDAEADRRLLVLLKSRFFAGVDTQQVSSRLANDFTEGDLQATSPQKKAEGLAWCARLLLGKSDRTEAVAILEAARKLGSGAVIEITDAFRTFYDGSPEDALSRLARINTSESRSAAFIIMVHSQSSEDALQWLDDTKTDTTTMDGDGKFFVLNSQLKGRRWNDAYTMAEKIGEDDFQRAPVLLYAAADAYLAQAVPDELRAEALAEIPLEASQFPLSSTAEALASRRKAEFLYSRAGQEARELGATRAADEAADRALWLALRDQEHRQEALSHLEASMRNPAHSLRRLSLAVQYRLKLDMRAVEDEIGRQNAITGGGSIEVALARLAMTLTKESPRAAADYLEKHRAVLIKFLNPVLVASIEIQLLVKCGQIQLAQDRLDALPQESDQSVLARLQRIISEAEGTDPIISREQLFKQSDSFTDLANLVELLQDRNEWPRLVTYGHIFFARSHELKGCLLLARALYEVGDFEGVTSLLSANPEFLTLSDSLLSLFAWSLYWLGDLKRASDNLNTLKQKRDDENDRSLTLNLAITSGDWNSLNILVEMEWDRRENRTAEELLRAGQLAQQLGSSRAKQLVEEAAAKGRDDAAILLGSYSAAVSGGWEDSSDVHQWLATAAVLSGTDGPVQQMSIKDMMDRQPDWQRREAKLWEMLQKGEAPIFVIADLLNRTLVDFFLFPALSNPVQADPRRRSGIFAYSGVRSKVDVSANLIALDPTSLLTFAMLGQLDRVLHSYHKIVVGHSTLGWLFEERQQVQFHQPSKIAEAREIKRLLAANDLMEFESTATVDGELSNEVGDDLAAMLADAEANFGVDKRQRVVVRPGPVHRVGSLMEEEADLSGHFDHLCSCADLVDALYRFGQLTETEAQRARDFLTVREKPWPGRFEIAPDAVLYLDELAVSYLQHLRLLAKLRAAGFTAVIPVGEIQLADRFIERENLSDRAAAVIEGIRKSLADGIASGKVVVARSSKRADDGMPNGRIKHHPGFSVMETASVADAVVVDDRYFNQHRNVSTGFGEKPIYTSYDLLTSDHFAETERRECATTIRRSGFCFVPVDAVDLGRMLIASPVQGDKVVENAELKALRESHLMARMSNSLQLPKEGTWLDNVMRVLLDVLKLQWQDGVDVGSSRARSNWLLRLLDIRGWAQRTNPTPQALVSEVRYRVLIMSLSLAQDIPQTQRSAYWKWLEEALLEQIKQSDPELYHALIAQVRSLIIKAINGVEDV